MQILAIQPQISCKSTLEHPLENTKVDMSLVQEEWDGMVEYICYSLFELGLGGLHSNMLIFQMLTSGVMY